MQLFSDIIEQKRIKMYLRGKYWHYDFRINKKRYRGSTGFVKSEKRKAVKMIEQLKAGIREDTSAQIISRIQNS